MRQSTRRTLTAAALALAGVLLGTSCSGAGGRDVPAAERLAAAKRALDQTSGVRIGLTSDELPRGVTGLVSADGVGTHDPAFEGSIKVSASGVTADAEIVAVDGVVHAMLPFTQEFVEIDPADYGAPNPADLMSTDGGLSSLLTDAEGVESGEDVRDGESVLSTITGTVPGDAVAAVLPSADPAAGFDAVFTLDERDRVVTVELTGPFYPDADAVTYTVEFSDYDVEKDIVAP